MVITLCDACGKQYRKYDSTSHGAGNGMSIYKKGKGGKIEPIIKLDLCDECMESVWSFVTEDLMQEASYRYSEIKKITDGTVTDESGEIGEVVSSSEEV